jgi:hypothetical protein
MPSWRTVGKLQFIIKTFANYVLNEIYVAVFEVLKPFTFILKMEAVGSSETMVTT